MLLAECSYLLLIILGISLPLSEIRCTVEITKHAECGIWKKPVAVLLNECLVVLLCGKFLECLVKSLAKEKELRSVHLFVIDLVKGIQFSLKGLVLIVNLDTYSRQMQELRMEGECRIRIVRI